MIASSLDGGRPRRVRKARSYSCCCLCGSLVTVGQTIMEIDAGGRAHLTPCGAKYLDLDIGPRRSPTGVR